jgi:polysaccharide pyruvyl transferase WcaK-like protein
VNEKKLINWGSYDVDNFGDLLFPFLVEHYLGSHYSEIIHVSPTGKQSIWPDTIPTCRIAETLMNKDIEGLIIGGGNLISWTTSSSVNYTESCEFAKIVHPSFFLIPYILRTKYRIPYAYNYIGVAKPIPNEKQSIVKITMESASFISCRDKSGAGRLRMCGVNSPILVGLDSAIDIRHVFPPDYLEDHYYKNNIQEKYGIPKNMVTAVVHIKERYLKKQFRELANVLSYLINHDVHPILIPLGMCHKDELIFNDQRFHGHTSTIIRRPELFVDILSILSLSQYYIGSSLHGAITSLSYHNKIIIVADEGESRFSKFSGFLSQVNLSECLYNSWHDAYANLEIHGFGLFKTTSSSTLIELDRRVNTWNDIYQSLYKDERNNMPSLLNDKLVNSIDVHYEI